MEYDDYHAQLEQEALQDYLLSDPVAKECKYVLFVSKTKGRGRKRRHWREVELLGYSGKWYQIKDGGGKIDVIAQEVLGDSCLAQDQEEEFLERLRRLYYLS